jgi:hypothetical protein
VIATLAYKEFKEEYVCWHYNKMEQVFALEFTTPSWVILLSALLQSERLTMVR